MAEQTILYLTFFAYLFLIFVIGIVAWLRTNTLSDYILGGRTLGKWTTAISAGASDMSGWLLLGLPGYAYLAGMEAIWIIIGLFIGTACNWYLVAPRLRQDTETLDNSLTIPEYFEHRFNDHTHLLRIISALIILLFYFFYTSSGLVAGGKLFESVFGISYTWSVVFGAGTILIYTCLGGFLAVSWSDLIQGLLMALALTVVALLAINQLNGFGSLYQSMQIINFELTDPFTEVDGQALGIIGIVSLLGWGLGYFGQPHILIRFMATDHIKHIPAARRIALSWTALGLIAALIIGFSGLALLPQHLNDADSEKVFIELLSVLLHPLPAGICLAAILAAIMSTADSQLLVASSAITEDMFKTFKKDASDQSQVSVGRIAVVILTIAATVLSLQPNNKVLDLVAYAWAGFGAAFGPVILFALFKKQLSRSSALMGMLSGGLTVIIWKNIQIDNSIFELYELVPGFVFACLTIFLVNQIQNSTN